MTASTVGLTEQAAQAIRTAYRRAIETALVVVHPESPVVTARGNDRLDLLNRMSTNKLDDMSPGQIRQTVLTNPVGQTVDWLRVLALPDHLALLASPDRGSKVHDWLAGYIFFQDDVQLELPSPWRLVGVYGPQAKGLLAGWRPELVPAGPDTFASLPGIFAWRVDRPAGGGFQLMAAQDHWKDLPAEWTSEADQPDRRSAYQALRIESGLPEVGAEILEDTIPLEAGLWGAVNFSKGCYIGQEIIARLESRGRLAKHLVGLRLDGACEPGAPVLQSQRKIGQITSCAWSPDLGWVGLGLIRPGSEPGDEGKVSVGVVPGRLVPLSAQP